MIDKARTKIFINEIEEIVTMIANDDDDLGRMYLKSLTIFEMYQFAIEIKKLMILHTGLR